MQSYTKIAYQVRGRDPGSRTPCEQCWWTAVDTHHIDGRTGKLLNDPKNLIFLCRDCHNRIHNNNTKENKEELKNIVLHIINDL